MNLSCFSFLVSFFVYFLNFSGGSLFLLLLCSASESPLGSSSTSIRGCLSPACFYSSSSTWSSSIVLFISFSPPCPPPPLPSLPLGDLLQTCLFDATAHLGLRCRSHPVIGAETRTSTENMGQGGRKYVCACVCLSADAWRVKRSERKQRERIDIRETKVETHTNHTCV